MSALTDAIAGLAASLKGAAGVVITYHRGDSSVVLTAIPGRSDVEVDDGQSLIQFASSDWLIVASELVIDDEQVVPEPADFITRSVGSATLRYDLFAKLPYRPSDPLGTVFRVHSRQTR